MSDGQIRDPYPIVHNKVLSPHFVNPTLRRARLIDWLNEHATNRAIVVAADAGYGKTTLLWQWEREVSFDCYWYKLDRNDRDWSLQISYLIEAVKERHPGFGDRTVSMLQQIGASSATGRATVTAYLISELNERLSEPATFIVDDWQFVASVTEVRGFWNQMLRDAPATCRFVFLARAKPQLQFARFAAHAGYAELRTDALRFTEDEIRLLFGEVYQDPLDPHELAEIERRTEGWAASLQLIEVSLRERKTRDERRAFIESITATRDSELFNFLAEEVLDQQPEQTRTFLLFTSILTQITPELAERMTGVHEGRKLLNDLEQRGIFTYRLDPETLRYRYHGLFRDFLERILKQERTDAEVVGLHIHAASYFETHSQWPDAIHHYLAAGLTSQAARLIARYGEDVVAGGRIGLVDEWLTQIPIDVIRSNARLSLLWGEALGMRGEWKRSLGTLDRARKFFRRKGDRRMEALACVKVSSVLNGLGAAKESANVALEGMELAPPDDEMLRLRLEGNYAVSGLFAAGRIDDVVRTLRRIAAAAHKHGAEHYEALARFNLGVFLRETGDIAGSVAALQRAASFWSDMGPSPFRDNADLVVSLLASGQPDRAERVAEEGMRNTQPWPRPNAEARFGRAQVHLYRGNYDGVIACLQPLVDDPEHLGALVEGVAGSLIEVNYLTGARPGPTKQLLELLANYPRDVRQEPYRVVIDAVAAHATRSCRGACQRARKVLSRWAGHGACWPDLIGRSKLSVMRLDHDKQDIASVIDDLEEFSATANLRLIRHWTRRLADSMAEIVVMPRGAALLRTLLDADPEFWRLRILEVMHFVNGQERSDLLERLRRNGTKSMVSAMATVAGDDVAEVRRNLMAEYADKIFVRAFGRLEITRGSWEGLGLGIGRQRPKELLGLLIAHSNMTLTRDQVFDMLWPDSSPAGASNSLNQAVFQLRRAMVPDYRDGEAPPYILSSTESVRLQTNLVVTDLDDFRRLALEARDSPSAKSWEDRVTRLVDLIRGEFLGDLRYEDWVTAVQTRIHAEVRQVLLPLALGRTPFPAQDIGIRAASALLTLDPYDEQAYIAIADRLAESGRRVAARELIARYAQRLREELSEPPSAELTMALRQLGGTSLSI